MRYYLDTEFNGFGGDLISLALVREDGRPLYLVLGCENPIDWVRDNVVPILDEPEAMKVRPEEVPHVIAGFLHGDYNPTIIADWPDDIAYFSKAVITGPGQMANIRTLKFEMYRVDAYPTTLQGAVQHNALWDARALRVKLQPPPL